jgi:hypothetical protein
MRRADAAGKLVGLLAAGPQSEAAHRALLAMRILTDSEADRAAIMRAGGIPYLVALLGQGPQSEHTEYAAAVLGNMAAGSQAIKTAIREAGPQPLLTAVYPCMSLCSPPTSADRAAKYCILQCTGTV